MRYLLLRKNYWLLIALIAI